MSSIESILQQHPQWSAVTSIYHTLKARGYKAFLAGGCVRDALMGRAANDLDIATDATPEIIEKFFTKTVGVGKTFGVMRVLELGQDIEVATFRSDGEYKDGRHPEEVTFTSPEEDAKRRDFTVNALFFDLEKSEVLDYVGGVADIEKGLIRTVGEASKRFSEDHLRLLRTVRFVAQLGFSIETETLLCLQKMSKQVLSVSGERIRDEWIKLLKSSGAAQGLLVAVSSGLMGVLFPFREKDASWVGPLGSEKVEGWQLLSLFLRTAETFDLEKALDFLKLSNKDRRAIEEAWAFWRHEADFWSLSLGRRLQRLSRPGVFFAFSQRSQETPLVKYKELSQRWLDMGAVLPSPYLSGDDVKGQVQGPVIGQVLEEGYSLQLEGKIHDRAQALQWVSERLKGTKA